MKTVVVDNSLAAIWAMRDSGELPDREREVYDAFLQHGPMTREEIAFTTRMKEGSACGRVNALMKRGIVVSHSARENPVTHKLNEVVDLAPARRAQHQHPEAA